MPCLERLTPHPWPLSRKGRGEPHSRQGRGEPHSREDEMSFELAVYCPSPLAGEGLG